MDVNCIVYVAVHGNPVFLSYFTELHYVRYTIWVEPYPTESFQLAHLIDDRDPTVAVYGHTLVDKESCVCDHAATCATITHKSFCMCLVIVTGDIDPVSFLSTTYRSFHLW